MTGGALKIYDDEDKDMFGIRVVNGKCYISARYASSLIIENYGGSNLEITNSGYKFSSEQPGFKVNNVSAVESYAFTPGSATGSFSKKVSYPHPNLSYAVIYYKCTYTHAYGSVKFPITKGKLANVVLKDFVDVDDSMIVGCIENIAVAVDTATMFTVTVTRGKPYRFAIKTSGNSINANPGPQFEITQVTLCG